jgi:L-methionine (R)-S-oxide reductase
VPDAAKVLATLSSCVQCQESREILARRAVEEIHAALPQAGWTGIYWLDGDMLELGPFVGPPTDHTRIPVGTGVCGTAVAEDKDQVVADVRTRENYLACSARTRSEIVVLIRSGGKVLGQIDIDSDQVAAFSEDDHGFLRMVAGALGSLLPLVPAKAAVAAKDAPAS